MTDWDFRGADTKRMTHGIHPYPAMMIPQIAARLIESYGQNARLLLDPFCGTGTSLLEANLHGINAVGTDLNPLARLIARVKTTPLGERKLKSRLENINDALFQARFSSVRPSLPVKNIDFWFPRKAQGELAFVLNIINSEKDAKVRRFLMVAFSETVRECSYTRNGEFKLYRMKEAQRQKFDPDVFCIFTEKLVRNFEAMRNYAATKPQARAKVSAFNSVQKIPPSVRTVDLVVTSPPYGDSRTTVAYGQFSRFANEWLGLEENASNIDARLMGGTPPKNTPASSLGCAKLEDAVAKIEARNPARAREVCRFYADYRKSAANIAASVKRGGFVCYVVGNRRVKGVELPTDEATRAYFCENGFRPHAAFVRAIPNKRMPAKNSPTNVGGVTDQTMTREHIVVLRKSANGAN